MKPGAVSFSRVAGDEIEVYDISGLLLDSRHFDNDGTFRYEDEEERVIRINGTSVR